MWRRDNRSGKRTEYELLGRRKHVKGEGDFILVPFALEPAEQGGDVGHYCVVHAVSVGKGVARARGCAPGFAMQSTHVASN